jgi:phage antirepressor YoqD-like protein
MKEIIDHTISTYDLSRIGNQMHSILLQNTKFTLGKMNKAFDKYLAKDGKSLNIPREVAEVVVKGWSVTQREQVSEHFDILEIEKALSKATVKKQVQSKAVVKVASAKQFDFDINKSINSLELVEIINNIRSEDSRPLVTHKDFRKKIKKVLGEGAGKFSDTYLHLQNQQQYPCYRLPQREASLMVMSESYKVQAAVYDRMMALESPVTNPALPNYPEALRQLACAMELAEEQAKQIEAAKPAVEFHHAVTSAENVHTFEEAAKVLNVGKNTLFGILRDNKVLTKANLPTQASIKQGHFTVVENPYKNSKGAYQLRASPRVTGKGLTYIQKFI